MPRAARFWDALPRFGHPSTVQADRMFSEVAIGYSIELRERRIVRYREVLAATRGDLAVRLQDWPSFPRGDFGELHRA